MVQDTTKEDHLFSSNCEKRMEILESFFSKQLKEILGYKDHGEKFKTQSLAGQECLIPKELKASCYHLFFYLQSWRVSISSSRNYINYKLPEKTENDLREFLNHNLRLRHKDLILHLTTIPSCPNIVNCLLCLKK
ncbi:MAG: hypothetical protein ACI8UX_002028 [Psychromonas sp.]|jgi:hypothetical protein